MNGFGGIPNSFVIKIHAADFQSKESFDFDVRVNGALCECLNLREKEIMCSCREKCQKYVFLYVRFTIML